MQIKEYILDIKILDVVPEIKARVSITDNYLINGLHILLQEALMLSYEHNYEFQLENKVYLDSRMNDLDELNNLNLDELSAEEKKNLSNLKYYDDTHTRVKEMNLKKEDVIQYTYNMENPFDIEIYVSEICSSITDELKVIEKPNNLIPDSCPVELYNDLMASEYKDLSKNDSNAKQLLDNNQTYDIDIANGVLNDVGIDTIYEAEL